MRERSLLQGRSYFVQDFPLQEVELPESSHTPSDSGNHGEALKPPPFVSSIARSSRKCWYERNTGRRQSKVHPQTACYALSTIRTMQYQGVYLKRCAGRPAENLVKQLSLGTTIRFPKIGGNRINLNLQRQLLLASGPSAFRLAPTTARHCWSSNRYGRASDQRSRGWCADYRCLPLQQNGRCGRDPSQ